MPIKVIAYVCKFRCRFSRIGKRGQVEEHEERCRLNPANRSCKSCEHDDLGSELSPPDGPEREVYNQCPHFPEEGWHYKSHGVMVTSMTMRRDCPHYKQK